MCSAALRNECAKWFPPAVSSLTGLPVTPTTMAMPFSASTHGPTTTSGRSIFFTVLSASCRNSASLRSESGCLKYGRSAGDPWSRSEKYRNPPTVRITALFASASPPCRMSARCARIACPRPADISSDRVMPSALTARQNAAPPPPPPSPSSPSASSSAPVVDGSPSSSAVTPCTTSDAASFTLKPCENEKDQNLRSVRPWLEPCSSSFSPSIFTCSGLMCEYCCLQTSSGRPMWVRSEFIA